VRIGTSEIYQQLQFFAGIQEALATALRASGDEQIVLFLKMHEGVRLTHELVADIRQRLREKCSPRHVPTHIVQAPDLPRTISGKLSEIAARNALSGQTAGNAGALANPDCLEFFRNLGTSGFGTEWNSDRSGRG
jgi:acetoacetyl-CoA synthetase